MSRIRSIHPGFWTDEVFASLSDAAALFYIGLLNEADDQGVFEWKPLTLRMRLRPSKDGSVDGLLAELVTRGAVRRYELDGRQFGAIRNFAKYQKPKKPKALHPITPEIGTYVRLSDGSSEPEHDEAEAVPPKSEKSPQMEDGGGKREVEEEGSLRSPRADAERNQVEQECREAAGLLDAQSPSLRDISPIWTLIAAGYDLGKDILPVLRAQSAAGKRGRSWAYYVPAITERHAANAVIPAKPATPPAKPTVWVLHESGEWASRAAEYRAANGKDPPRVAGLGGMGWHFPVELVPQAIT